MGSFINIEKPIECILCSKDSNNQDTRRDEMLKKHWENQYSTLSINRLDVIR